MRRIAFGLVALASACTDHEVLIAPTNGAKSMIVVTLEGTTPKNALAFDVAQDSAFYSLPVPSNDADLLLLGYGCSLDDLKLEPGALSLAEGRGRRFMPTGSVLRSEVRAGRMTEWEKDPSNEILARIRIDQAPVRTCATFELINSYEITRNNLQCQLVCDVDETPYDNNNDGCPDQCLQGVQEEGCDWFLDCCAEPELDQNGCWTCSEL